MRTIIKLAAPLAAALAVLAATLPASAATPESAKPAQAVGSPTIIGGRPASENYPLAVTGNCSGVLVAPHWILTAAHCGEAFQYTVGSPDFAKGQTVDWGGWGTRYPTADVALFPFVQAATVPVLPIAKLAPALGQPTRIVGWGLTCQAATCNPPLIANELDTSVIADSKCTNKDLPINGAYEFCVNNPGGKAGACYGDSGGPMLKKVDGGKWAVVGITSRPGDGGEICAVAPSIYTDVTTPAIQKWIADTIAGRR